MRFKAQDQYQYASSGNNQNLTIKCHQSNENYEESRHKLGTFLENKVFLNQSEKKHPLVKTSDTLV
jgi:hypothetical protein